MTLYLLDSSVHIHSYRSVPAVVEWLDTAAIRGDDLVTSVICAAEVLAGAHAHEVRLWRLYFGAMPALPVGYAEAQSAGRLRYDLARRGYQIQLPDALIAATALESDAVLVTANAKDFVQTGVRVFELAP